MGDVVDYEDNTADWVFASNVQALIDNADIPNGITVGNHDNHSAVYSGTHNYYLDYFNHSRYSGFSWYGGSYLNDYQNNYQLFSAGGMEFIVIHLQWGIKDNSAAMSWASGLLSTYSTRRAIVVTHGILETDGTAVWDNVAKQHDNVFMYLGGHTCGGVWRDTPLNNYGNPVQKLKIDYQCEPYGGNGKLGYFTFKPNLDEVDFTVYSTWTDTYHTADDFSFSFQMP